MPEDIHPPTRLSGELGPGVVDSLLSGDGAAAAALARRGENEWVEVKERLPHTRELAKYLTAFANSGGGVLVVGMAGNGKPLGGVKRMRTLLRSGYGR